MRLHIAPIVVNLATAISAPFLMQRAGMSDVQNRDTTEALGPNKANIMFILLDDLGWSEVGFNNESTIDMPPTPQMDKLAGQGVVLKRHYVHKFCSPTRSAIQSGRAPIHVNVNNAHIESHNPADLEGGFAGMPRNMTGIAKVLKKAGYKTHMVGKWDIGVATPDHLPVGRGYDSSLIYFEHTNDNWKFRANVDCGHLNDLWEHDETIPWPGRPALRFMNEEGCTYETHVEGAHCVYEDELFERRVVDIMDKHDSAEPLFLFWATHAVHGPYQPPTFNFNRMKVFGHNSANPNWFSNRAAYYGGLDFIDGAIGRVIDKVNEKGLYENMLIVLSTDNGAVAGMSNEPLRGGKFTNFEGGIRAVSCVSGGVVPSSVRGTSTHGLIAAQDWYATFAHLAGVDPTDDRAAAAKLPPIDSINVWPLLSGEIRYSPRDAFFIGTTAGGYAAKARRFGQPTIGGVVRYFDGKLYKLLLGDTEDERAECDMVFGPAVSEKRPKGFSPNTDCPLRTRRCGVTPETGCLFDLEADPMEKDSLAAKEPILFRKLLEDCRMQLKLVYAPERGDVIEEDCAVMESLHAGFLGPFLVE